jgi:hypothetical protein
MFLHRQPEEIILRLPSLIKFWGPRPRAFSK